MHQWAETCEASKDNDQRTRCISGFLLSACKLTREGLPPAAVCYALLAVT